jgi:hypothetical protein
MKRMYTVYSLHRTSSSSHNRVDMFALSCLFFFLFFFSTLDYDCGTTSTGVRKACKNCTCGLAQELEQEEHEVAKQTVKSSCGSVSDLSIDNES